MPLVAFDNTLLSVLLNPNGRVPFLAGTQKPVEMAVARANFLVTTITSRKGKIILPAPACAELLTAIGPASKNYLSPMSNSQAVEVGSFDARCATELADLNTKQFAEFDKVNRIEPYQKRKVDRQILAICRVYGVEALYTDDKGLRKQAALCGIHTVGLAELPLPPEVLQGSLNLEDGQSQQESDLIELEESGASLQS